MPGDPARRLGLIAENRSVVSDLTEKYRSIDALARSPRGHRARSKTRLCVNCTEAPIFLHRPQLAQYKPFPFLGKLKRSQFTVWSVRIVRRRADRSGDDFRWKTKNLRSSTIGMRADSNRPVGYVAELIASLQSRVLDVEVFLNAFAAGFSSETGLLRGCLTWV